MTMPPGLLVSAPASGTGKTTVTLGLLRALRDRGLTVQPFKSGPDYIDPAFHEAAAGRRSFNLDSWAMDETLFATIATEGQGADIAIGEGSMGLFDGVAGQGASGFGTSAETAVPEDVPPEPEPAVVPPVLEDAIAPAQAFSGFTPTQYMKQRGQTLNYVPVK